jgi:hypothetical protein
LSKCKPCISIDPVFIRGFIKLTFSRRLCKGNLNIRLGTVDRIVPLIFLEGAKNMNRYIIPTFLSIAVLSSQAAEASSQPSKEDPKINFVLKQIQDEALRELVWDSTLEISKGTSWDSQDLSGIASTIATLKPEQIALATKCAAKLAKVETLVAKDICNLITHLCWLSPEQAEAFVAITDGKAWKAEEFECVTRSLQRLPSETAPEVGRVFALNTQDASWSGAAIGYFIDACKGATSERIALALKAIDKISEGKEWTPWEYSAVFSKILELKSSGEQLDALLSLVIYSTKNRICNEHEVRTLIHLYNDKSREHLEALLEYVKSIPALETLEFSHWKRVIDLIRTDISRDDLRKLSKLVRFFGEDLGWTGNDYVSALESITRNSVEYQFRNAPILIEAAAGRNWDAETYGRCSVYLCNEFDSLVKNKQALMHTLDLLDENKPWIEDVSFLFKSCSTASKEEVMATMKQLEYIANEYKLDARSRSELMRNLSRVPFKQISGLLSFIEPIVKRTGWHDAHANLIDDLRDSSEKQLVVLTTNVIPAIAAKGLDAVASCQCIAALKQKRTNEIDSLLGATFTAMQDQSDLSEDIGFITYGTAHAPKERVLEVLGKLREFAQASGWTAEAQSQFIQHFVDRNWDLIEIFLEAAESLSEGKKWHVVDFINLTNVMNCSRGDLALHKHVLQRTVSAIKSAAAGKEWEASTYNDILLALSQTPLERIDETFTSAITLVEEEKLPMKNISSLIHACSTCTLEQAREALPKVYAFMIEKEWSPSLQSKCLSSLYGVPMDRKAETLTALVALADKQAMSLEELSYSEASALMQSFSQIAPDRIVDVIDAIHSLSKGKPRASSFYVSLVGIFGSMDKDGIVTALGKVQAVNVGRELHDYEIAGILWSAGIVQAERIPELLMAANRFMSTIDLTTHDKTSICGHFGELLAALSNIPTKRLDAILDVLITLNSVKRATLWSQTKLIEILSSASVERLAFILKAMPTIELGRGHDDEATEVAFDVVAGLLDVRMERFDEVLDAFKFLSAENEWDDDESSSLFLSLCRLPSSCQLSAVTKKISSAAAGKDWSLEAFVMITSLLGKVDMDSWDRYIATVEPLCCNECELDPTLLIMPAIDILPESQLAGYIEAKVLEYQQDPEALIKRRDRDQDPVDDVLAHILAMSLAGGEHRLAILNYWRDVMASDDKFQVQTVCEFIEGYVLELGFEEEDPLVQMARRVLTVFEDGDENGAHTIFEKLKAKRTVPMQWDQLKRVQGTIAGLNVRLSPEKIASFGICMKLDATSIPMIKSPALISLLSRLREVLLASKGESNAQTLLSKATKIYMTTMPGYDPERGTFKDQGSVNLEKGVLELVDEALSSTGHFCRLMDASWKNMEGTKMKCVASYFLSLPDSEETWLRICQFLAGVRGCMYGKDTAIQDYYMGLDSSFRLRTLAANKDYDFDLRQVPAITALFNAVQSVVSLQFSPESKFMREVCGVVVADAEFEFAAHQIIWVKGLIGDMVGLTEGPRFDIHAGTANRLILARTLQEVMEIYYDRLEMNQIIPLMRTAFDRLLVKDLERRQAIRAGGVKGEDDRSIYGAMQHIFEQCKAKNPEEVFETEDKSLTPWLEFKYANDDDTTGRLSITDRGVVRLMGKVGLLDEITDPLGWGN